MLLAWIIVSACLLFIGLIIAWAAYADMEETMSAWIVVGAALSWTWPVAVPLAILFGLTNLAFFTAEALTEWERPEWWPVQP